MPAITAQRVPVADMPMSRPQREAAVLTAYAFALIALSATTGLLIRWRPLPTYGAVYFTQDLWYIILFKLIGMLLIPAGWFFSRGYRFRDLQPLWVASPRRIAWTVAAFAIGCFLNLSYVPQIRSAFGHFPDAIIRVVFGVVAPLISAAIPEEFYFRGLLQTRLEAVWGRLAAILVSVTLFAAWHLPTRYLLANGVEGSAGHFTSVLLGTGVPVFIVGLIFAIVYDRYRSLVPLIACHWAIDLLPSVASFFGIAH